MIFKVYIHFSVDIFSLEEQINDDDDNDDK